MLIGTRDQGVNVHALVASEYNGVRLTPRLLNDGRYVLPDNALTDSEYTVASESLSSWASGTTTDFYLSPEGTYYLPLPVLVDGKYMFQVGRRSALTMPHQDVFRYEVHANDFAQPSDSTNKNRRCELVSRKVDGVGDAQTVWMSTCVIRGDSPGLLKTPHGIVLQWHSDDLAVARPPVLSINYANSGLRIRTCDSGNVDANGMGYYIDRYTATDLPAKGVKTHIVMQATFGQAGHLNAWINGTQVVNIDCPIGYYNDLTDGSGRTILGYPQFGLYTGNQPDVDTIYHANFEWGQSDLSGRIATPLPVPDLMW